MSDYTKATNFTLKDGLSSGDAGKIIKGSEIDAEYTAIASAVTSKADLNGPTFTGTPSAPTASTGTSSTQIATTAFVQSALVGAYPVGSIYMNATVATNPATLLGFGTWVAFGAGKVPIGLDATDTDFDTVGETPNGAASLTTSTSSRTTRPTLVPIMASTPAAGFMTLAPHCWRGDPSTTVSGTASSPPGPPRPRVFPLPRSTGTPAARCRSPLG